MEANRSSPHDADHHKHNLSHAPKDVLRVIDRDPMDLSATSKEDLGDYLSATEEKMAHLKALRSAFAREMDKFVLTKNNPNQ